jgi:glycerol-3-phosphate O-acyltransferase
MSEKFAMAADAAGTRQLPLAVGATGTERRLLEQWLDNGGLEGQTDPLLFTEDPTYANDLQCEGDVRVVPLRVVWLPKDREGRRRARWSDLALLGNPRRPGRRRQRHIASVDPDRYRVVAGEAALLTDLRKRYQAEVGSVTGPEAFARYVRRAAVVTLERAERSLIGDRY